MLLSLIWLNHSIRKDGKRLSTSVLDAYFLEDKGYVFGFTFLTEIPGTLEVLHTCLIP